MSRFAKEHRVFFIEEPEYTSETWPALRHSICQKSGVHIIVPEIPETLAARGEIVLKQLIGAFLREETSENRIAWFYSPMAVEWGPSELPFRAVCYDCMDELSLFHNAPPRLKANEQKLFKLADVVFTGGVSLFEAKCTQHPNVHAFPSSIDFDHFAQARAIKEGSSEQAQLPHPRLGFAGVIDERMDLELLREMARLRPDWQFIMIGPVVKISTDLLPREENIRWLGSKPYSELPSYFAGWDVGMMPFLLNDATKYISPTKTPEYLSAGLPVVSTAIRDVVRPYGELGLVSIASTAPEFIAAAERAMVTGMSMKWRERADAFLRTSSWDSTWAEMNRLIREVVRPTTKSRDLAEATRV